METERRYYPIRNVAEITGVNPVTLRAWERRYGLLQPHRTDSGHRLYTEDDIRLVQQVTTLLNEGQSISEVVRSLQQGVAETAGIREDNADIWETHRARMLEAIERFDERAVEQAYQEILGLYPIDTVNTLLIRPLLQHLGNCWKQSRTGIAQEHFFTAYLRKKLGARLHHSNLQTHGPRLILCSPPGEHHELGMLLFAVTAVSHGLRLIMLGPDMPLSELTAVAAATAAEGVILSMSTRPSKKVIGQELPALIRALEIPLFIGGQYAVTHADELAAAGAFPVGSEALPALRSIRARL